MVVVMRELMPQATAEVAYINLKVLSDLENHHSPPHLMADPGLLGDEIPADLHHQEEITPEEDLLVAATSIDITKGQFHLEHGTTAKFSMRSTMTEQRTHGATAFSELEQASPLFKA
jgi:hypothetical protein